MDNIEIIDGTALFASGRGEPGWHKLGVTVEGLMTKQEALEKAHLANWNVRKEELRHFTTEADVLTVPDKFVLLRDNPINNEVEAMSVVGNSYKVFQNEEAFTFAQDIVDIGARWDTAGSLDKGRRVFGSLIIDRDFTLDPDGANDKVVTYLLVATSHNGSLALTYVITPVRVVCQNTLNIALGNHSAAYSIKHTKKADTRLIEARKALNVTFDFMDDFEAEAKELFEREVTKQKFDTIVKAVFGDRPTPDITVQDDGSNKVSNQAAITRWENKRDLLHDIYGGTGDVMNNTENIRGTAWGAWNAFTEYADWYRQTRGDSNNLYEGHLGLTANVTDFKREALDAVKELTAV